MRFDKLRYLIAPAALAGGYFFLLQACGNDMPTGPAGGAVTGAEDMHCTAPDGGMITQPTSQASCQARPDAAPAGTPDANMTTSDYGTTLFNAMGNDDDCKYHYMWTATPIYENYDVHFHLTLTNLVDGTPATGANPEIEAFLSDTHAAPPTDQNAKETAAGQYDIGPVQFDQAGKWTVRFHVYHTCLDLVDTSPHGHAAFYVNVP